MKLLPMIISAQRGNWRLYQGRKRNAKFLELKKKILQRDQYTCRYCGFMTKEFQEVVNIDQNYKNNRPQNMATACGFCAQCFFIDSVGVDSHTGGNIIYLPEISQAALNNFCRVLYCSLDKDSIYKGKLQSVFMSLKDRSNDVVTCFGPDASEPRVFGQGLLDATINKDNMHNEVLRHLRLLPSKKAFTPQIEYWKKTIFAKVPL